MELKILDDTSSKTGEGDIADMTEKQQITPVPRSRLIVHKHQTNKVLSEPLMLVEDSA